MSTSSAHARSSAGSDRRIMRLALVVGALSMFVPSRGNYPRRARTSSRFSGIGGRFVDGAAVRPRSPRSTVVAESDRNPAHSFEMTADQARQLHVGGVGREVDRLLPERDLPVPAL